MSYTLNYRWGESEDGESFTVNQLMGLLSQLDEMDDPEHGDISVSDNESNVSISVFAGNRGLIVLEDEDESFHMTGVDRRRSLDLLSRFVSAGASSLRREEPRIPGYGS